MNRLIKTSLTVLLTNFSKIAIQGVPLNEAIGQLHHQTTGADKTTAFIKNVGPKHQEPPAPNHIDSNALADRVPDSCTCEEIALTKSLALLNEHSGPFKPAHDGDPPQTFTFFDPKEVNAECGLAGETQFCEQFEFLFTDSETKKEIKTWPRNAIAWQLKTKQLTFHPSSDDQAGLHKILLTIYRPTVKEQMKIVEILYSVQFAPNDPRSLQKKADEEKSEPETGQPHRLISTGQGYCLNSQSMLNLLNSAVLAEQNTFDTGNSLLANTACNGDVICINTGNPPASYSTIYQKLPVSGSSGTTIVPQFWKATFTQEILIKTALLINRDDSPYITRIQNDILTVGNNADVSKNPICVTLGRISDGGWYMCPASLTGTTLGIYTTSKKVGFFEIMAYSQEAIQLNVGVTVSFLGTNIPTYPASNALQYIVVLLVNDYARQHCVQIVSTAGGLAKLSIKFNAQVPINGVAVIPGYQPSLSSWPGYQTNVAIYGSTVLGTQQLCGVLANYYTKYSEILCNVQANEIILVQQNSAQDLRFCGFGALSDCNCAQSSFDPLHFTTTPETYFASVTSITVKYTDSSQSIKFNTQIPDTVSSVCGSADGFSKCGLGPRVIFFKDKITGQLITFPYKGFNFDASTSELTLNPGQANAICVLTAIIQFVNYPTVTYQQDITTIVQGGISVFHQLSIPTLPLNATINEQALLKLPQLSALYAYFVKSNQSFSATVDGIQLLILSTNETDVGTQYLDLVAVSTNDTVSFKVKIIFKSALNDTKTQSDSVQDVDVLNTTQIPSSTDVSLASDLLDQLNKVTCNDDGVCVDPTNNRFSCQLNDENGQMMCGLDLHFEKLDTTTTISSILKVKRPPVMVVQQVSKKGTLTLTFSEPMDFSSLINTTFSASSTKSTRRLAKKTGGKGGDGKFDGGGISEKVYSTQQTQNSTNYTNVIDFNRYKYLLSDEHLRLTIKPNQDQNATQLQFEWFAVEITNTTIKIQILFQYPTYISSDRRMPDSLLIKLLPGILELKSQSYQMIIFNPLRTENKILPPQLILGSVTDNVETAAGNLKNVGQGVVVGNFIMSAVLNGAMGAVYTMINSLQMVMVISLLIVAMPANVNLVMVQINTMASFDYLPSDLILAKCFSFSTALMPLVAFQEFGDLSVRLTFFLGSFIIVSTGILLASILFIITWPFTKKYKLVMRYHSMMQKNYYWRGIIRMILESYFDLCLGIMFSWQQPRFDTPSDIFDFALTFFFTLVVIAAPPAGYKLLSKYEKELDGTMFQDKYGSLTEGYRTTGELGSASTVKTIVWFFVRRFLTALALVYLGGSSPVFQITAVMYLSLVDVLMNFHLSAYESKMSDFVAKINDIIVFLLSYFPVLYAGLIQDTELIYQIGLVQSGLVGMMFLANMTVVIIYTISNTMEECRRIRVERFNFSMLKYQGYDMIIVVKSGWQTLAQLCTIDWAFYDTTAPRLNVQISPYVQQFLHQQAEDVVDQIDEFQHYEEQKNAEQANSDEQIFPIDQTRVIVSEQIPVFQEQSNIEKEIMRIAEPLNEIKEETKKWDQSRVTTTINNQILQNQASENKVVPLEQYTQQLIQPFKGGRQRIVADVPDQVEDAKAKLNQLKAHHFVKIMKSLAEESDPVVANHSRNLAALQISNLLPDEISQMSEKDLKDEVKNLMSVIAESEKIPDQSQTSKLQHSQQDDLENQILNFQSDNNRHVDQNKLDNLIIKKPEQMKTLSQTQAFDQIMAQLVACRDPIAKNGERNLQARYFADLLPFSISQMSLKNQEGEVRNLISLVRQVDFDSQLLPQDEPRHMHDYSMNALMDKISVDFEARERQADSIIGEIFNNHQ